MASNRRLDSITRIVGARASELRAEAELTRARLAERAFDDALQQREATHDAIAQVAAHHDAEVFAFRVALDSCRVQSSPS